MGDCDWGETYPFIPRSETMMGVVGRAAFHFATAVLTSREISLISPCVIVGYLPRTMTTLRKLIPVLFMTSSTWLLMNRRRNCVSTTVKVPSAEHSSQPSTRSGPHKCRAGRGTSYSGVGEEKKQRAYDRGVVKVGAYWRQR